MVIVTKYVVQNKVRELRFFHGEMSQKTLAETVGVSRQTIVAIEKGKYSPTLELAFRIAMAFDKRVDEVFYMEKA
ncbi:helix-turn-helix transcriptional regulator [Candidatus Xianfuyuplasma coldseepsis]|uniref:Helix-turn-helix transcriptional regulator n=2 Tax=Candidatus Xianfuyuplasma coldseepsis TaxID=2782163 RepID=A0A7L7KR30_9MOLU|nr:helix-turn-helix transcriptional regulator [Xianfuyuplasma coldseepsis]